MEENRRRRNPKYAKGRSPFQKKLRLYMPSILLGVICVLGITAIVLTVKTISSFSAPADNGSMDATPPSTTAPIGPSQEVQELIAEADFIAAGYDYDKAIAMLQSYAGYETDQTLQGKVALYTAQKNNLVSYPDMSGITHIFFHSLIVDTSRAFDGDEDHDGYNLYMTTIYEFEQILEQMYERGYVLVSPYDVAYEKIDANGSPRFSYGDIRLPEGKTPFLMSQDDVNYYGYMIGTGNGKGNKPVFADNRGDGFASKLVIGEDGYPTCEYRDKNGNVTYGDYDLVPILERFIQEHPDFSYRGARAILGVTGYEGVLGYRTKPSYAETIGEERFNEEVEQAKAVAQCLKDHGWILASHSYGHPAYGNLSAGGVKTDSDKWEETCEYIIGETDIILYPHGSDIAGVKSYTQDNAKFVALYEDGYRYFFNVDSHQAWCQLGKTYFRGGRRNLDGYRMYHDPDKIADLIDANTVLDPNRPLPVPNL